MTRTRYLTLALLAAITPASCDHTADCADNTVLLALTLGSAANGATALDIIVAVDGAISKTSAVALTPGTTRGTVQIDFPRGYPAGKKLGVSVSAKRDDAVLATATATRTLGPSCERLALALDGGSCTATVAICPADACGRVPDGCTGYVTCSIPCSLTSLAPSIANTGDTVVLEGTFSGATTVDFPGAPAQPATVLGPHRATATVPAAATAGDLVVHTGYDALSAIPFRHALYPLGLGREISGFFTSEPQADIGRTHASMVESRFHPAALAIGEHLFLIGGRSVYSPFTPSATIEATLVSVDGSLNGFALLPNRLVQPRFDHVVLHIGAAVYVIGGTDGTHPIEAIERAVVDTAGNLGSFSVAGQPKLGLARSQHAAIVIGTYVYVIGGVGTDGDVGSIERAPIQPDGTLGSFAPYPSSGLVLPRHAHAALVTANGLYVVGGMSGQNELSTVESAPITPQGDLGAFTASPLELHTANAVRASLVLGHTVYILGSHDIEKATLNADGTLNGFNVDSPYGVSDLSAVALARDNLYFAGDLSDGPIPDVSRSSLNIGGDLGGFADISPRGLSLPLSQAVAMPSGDSVYLIGGRTVDGPTATVQRVSFGADDSITSVSSWAGSTLNVPRQAAAGAVTMGFVYIVGGYRNMPLGTVERAPINRDGTLGPFQTMATQLTTPRYGHRMLIDTGICVVGGQTASGPTQTIECASLDRDGSVGSWTASPVALASPRYASGLVRAGDSYWAIGGAASVAADRILVKDFTRGQPFMASNIKPSFHDFSFSILPAGNFVYLIGSDITNVERADLAAIPPGGFVRDDAAAVQRPVKSPAALVVGNRAYILGGEHGEMPLDVIQAAPLQ